MEAEVYDQFFRAEDLHWWFRARRRIIASVLEGLYPGGGLRIADVGCGTGGMIQVLSRFGSVTGVDEAPQAREYCVRRGLDRVLSPAEWAATDERYDLVTAFDVVEHVEDDTAFLRGLAARLGPRGRLLVTVPAYPFLWSFFDEMNHHRRRYTRKTLETSLRGAGVAVERTSHFNAILLPPVIAVRLFDKAFRREPRDAAGRARALESWFKVGPMNGVFETIFASERGLLRRGDLPCGSSILALGASGEEG